ncbi:MAG: hypothetical protein ACT6T0_01290 [Nevskia sp.]|uniref:hypothetical protein n=1 Tax=Nevskia sp. TaxID=1929292 RepID=UPI004035F9A6
MSSGNSNVFSSRHYKVLGSELKRRTKQPAEHPTFLIYFVLSVVTLGGAGIWFEVYSFFYAAKNPNLEPLRTALTTFFPAIAGSTTLQLILAENNRSLKAFAILCLFLVAGAALITAPKSAAVDVFAMIVGIGTSLFACWIWWITNADTPEFKDVINPDAALGGDRATVQQVTLSGDLSGFDH